MSQSATPVMVRLRDGAELEGTFYTGDPNSAKIAIRLVAVSVGKELSQARGSGPPSCGSRSKKWEALSEVSGSL